MECYKCSRIRKMRFPCSAFSFPNPCEISVSTAQQSLRYRHKRADAFLRNADIFPQLEMPISFHNQNNFQNIGTFWVRTSSLKCCNFASRRSQRPRKKLVDRLAIYFVFFIFDRTTFVHYTGQSTRNDYKNYKLCDQSKP